MNRRQEVWAWGVFFIVVGVLILFAATAYPQTLQRRPPGTMPRESCREHIVLSRHVFFDAAKIERDFDTQTDLMNLYNNFNKEKVIQFWCQGLEKDYDFVVSLAELRCRVNARRKEDCP